MTPHWVALAGPTASGKSAAALAVAAALADSHRRPVEIVSVDSAQVYRGMDIGTAKPGASERSRVRHHLIDIIEPLHAYSAARFVADATSAIEQIRARGALPLLVGGTMLYFRALMQGLDAMPAADPAVRAQIEAEAAQRGWPALHAELACVDAATAQRLAAHDAQRIQRALEVFRISGQPLSSFHRAADAAARNTAPLIALEPLSRAWLHERIAMRFDAMLDAGLIDEVRALRARGAVRAGLPSMRCVGYRQVMEALDLGFSGDALRQQLVQSAVPATRQLAKRQLTWLRSMPQRQVVPCDAPDAAAQVIAAVQRCCG
jgi:tRNA dimethylallyltransferase